MGDQVGECRVRVHAPVADQQMRHHTTLVAYLRQRRQQGGVVFHGIDAGHGSGECHVLEDAELGAELESGIGIGMEDGQVVAVRHDHETRGIVALADVGESGLCAAGDDSFRNAMRQPRIEFRNQDGEAAGLARDEVRVMNRPDDVGYAGPSANDRAEELGVVHPGLKHIRRVGLQDRMQLLHRRPGESTRFQIQRVHADALGVELGSVDARIP